MERKPFKREAFPGRVSMKKEMFPGVSAFPKNAAQPLPTAKPAPKVKAKVKTPVKSKKVVKAVSEEKVARAELWTYDEYGQGSIIASSTKLSEIITRARKHVTEMNVDNSLAGGERDKNWEGYFPEIFVGDKPSSTMLYAGNRRDGKHHVWVNNDGVWSNEIMHKGTSFRFYLGEISNGRTKVPWYLSDVKGKIVTSIDDQSLERKAILFIKIL